MPKYTDDELKSKILADLEKFGAAPSLEILARRLHVSYSRLRRLGKVKDIYHMVGVDVGLPKYASQFECCVYSLLLEYFPDEDIVYQKTFPGCRTSRLLPFDFYIKSINLIVEADGAQHYSNGKREWSDTRTTDAIKNEFCKNNNIAILRIRHRRYKWKLNNLRKILEKIRLHAQETGHAYCFNCWDGGEELLPISSQADIKHKKKALINISYRDELVVYNINGIQILLDKSIYDNMTYGLYLKNGKVYRSDTGKLMANTVLNITGTKGAFLVRYADGNTLNLQKHNLQLLQNSELPRSSRGAYKTSKTGDTRITLSRATVKGKVYTSYVVRLPNGKKKYVNISKFNTQEDALAHARMLLSEGSTTIPQGSTD